MSASPASGPVPDDPTPVVLLTLPPHVEAPRTPRRGAKVLSSPRGRTRRNPTATGPLRPSAETWRALVESYPWPSDEALRILHCESRGDANAISPSGRHRGLMQITDGPLDPRANLDWAYHLWSRKGWRPWSCRPH